MLSNKYVWLTKADKTDAQGASCEFGYHRDETHFELTWPPQVPSIPIISHLLKINTQDLTRIWKIGKNSLAIDTMLFNSLDMQVWDLCFYSLGKESSWFWQACKISFRDISIISRRNTWNKSKNFFMIMILPTRKRNNQVRYNQVGYK